MGILPNVRCSTGHSRSSRLLFLPFSIAIIIGVCSILHPFSFLDRYWMSSFETLPDNRFDFSADTTSFTLSESDPGAEAVRMEWLEEFLREYHFCEKGYEIAARTAVLSHQTITGPVHKIYYLGKCKGE